MVLVAIVMDDGSVRRMQCVSEKLIVESIKKLPWADRVTSWRFAEPEEFQPGCRWRDKGGKIVGEKVVAKPERDLAAEIDVLRAALVARSII